MEYSQFAKMRLIIVYAADLAFCITSADGNALFFSAMSARNNNCCYVSPMPIIWEGISQYEYPGFYCN